MKEVQVTKEVVGEKSANLANMKVSIEKKVREYNALGSDKEVSATKVYKTLESIDSDIKEFNKLSMEKTFDTCLLGGGKSALYEAAKLLYYPVLKTKEQRIDKDSDDTELVLVDDVRIINPKSLSRYSNHEYHTNVGVDNTWYYGTKKLGYLYAIKVAQDVSPAQVERVKKRYDIDNRSMDIDLGIKSVSNRDITKTFDKLLDSMLGDGERVYQHTVSHDVAFFRELYTTKGKDPMGVRCATPNKLAENMMKIAHHVVTGAEYGVEFKERKEAINSVTEPAKKESKEEPEKQEKDQPKKNRRKSQPKAEDAAA